MAAEVRALAETVDHDPADARARSRSASAIDLRARAPLRRRRGGGHRPRRAGGGRGGAPARPGATSGPAGAAEDARAAARGRAPRRPRCRRCARRPRRELVAGRRAVPRRSSGSRPACSRWRSAGGRPARDEPAVEVDGDAVAFDADRASTRSSSGSPRTPGEPARPLARIASGGELSRVALAIKQVLAEADETPTLVFDEVDTGIGGRSADPVGRSLWALARRHQVLCVTHLPQIAAHADAHFRIAKRERDGRTVTEVAPAGPRRARSASSPRCSAARTAGEASARRRPRAARPGRGVARRAAVRRRSR